MKPQFVREFDFAWGRPDRLSSLVTRIICENPGPFTFTGSGSYLIGENELAIIDPGPDNAAHLAAVKDLVDGRRVSHILVTHTHIDHCGGWQKFRATFDAPVLAFGPHPVKAGDAGPKLDEGGDVTFRPDALLQDGDIVRGDGWTLEAVHTPGHIGNHLCFALAEENALFTGDHIMGWATTVVTPPDGNMADYMESLNRLSVRQDEVFYPTHGAPVEAPGEFIRAIKAHRLSRDAEILAALSNGPRPIMELVAEIYAETDKALHFAAALNVIAHLEWHVERGQAMREGEPGLAALYRREKPQ